jgi:hypothetical protein
MFSNYEKCSLQNAFTYCVITDTYIYGRAMLSYRSYSTTYSQMETSFLQVVRLCVRHTYIQNINLLQFTNLEHVYVRKMHIFVHSIVWYSRK